MEHYKAFSPFFKEKTLKIAEQWQLQMHEFVEKTMEANPNVSYQDATNTFLLLKMAEMEAIETNRLICEDFEKQNELQFKH